MRKFIPLIVLSILILLSASCRRTSHNGKIDGFWKVMEIRYDDDVVAAGTVPSETVSPENKFICINLELIQFGNPNPAITGVIAYNKGDSKLGIDFQTNSQSNTFLSQALYTEESRYHIMIYYPCPN